MRDAFRAGLSELFGREVEVSEPLLLAGGASKEAWAVDADGVKLLVRRAAATVMHHHTLTLAQEFAVLEAAYEAGVKVPRPYGYLVDLAGREAFAMERLEGETIGRRIVRKDELAAARERLPLQLAEELARIHAIPPERLPFLPEARIDRFVDELDEVGEPHPAIELGLWWLREHRPPARPVVVNHGDFRLGNVVVGPDGLVGVLDWEFAHLDDPVRDLAFGMVRAWRFGVPERRFGGIDGAAVRRAVQRADGSRRAAGGARLLGARGQRRVGDRLPDAGAAPPGRARPEHRARDARAPVGRGRV